MRKELGFSREEFDNLSWIDRRMYLEEYSIYEYELKYANWESAPEEERGPEPEKPFVLLLREEEEWLNQEVAPDIMDLLEAE